MLEKQLSVFRQMSTSLTISLESSARTVVANAFMQHDKDNRVISFKLFGLVYINEDKKKLTQLEQNYTSISMPTKKSPSLPGGRGLSSYSIGTYVL